MIRQYFAIFFLLFIRSYGQVLCFGPYQPQLWLQNQGTSISKFDFNSDGQLDICSGGNTFDVTLLLSNGSGSYTSVNAYSVALVINEVHAVDVNNDGKGDIVALSSQVDSLIILFGDRSGTFTKTTSYATGNNPASLQSGHFNSDVYFDLALINKGSGSVTLFLGSATGTFSSAITNTFLNSPVGLLVGDFNNNGKSDLFMFSNQ